MLCLFLSQECVESVESVGGVYGWTLHIIPQGNFFFSPRTVSQFFAFLFVFGRMSPPFTNEWSGTSTVTSSAERMKDPTPILMPGDREVWMPVRQCSPSIAPSFIRCVERGTPSMTEEIGCSSSRRFPVTVPPPSDTPLPRIESPT